LKRKKKIYENTEARDLRKQEIERIAAQEERRKRLLANLAKSGDQGDGADIIINETKLDQEGFIYVNQKIARRIKRHQIEGVRFLWNQIVAGKQGCLLAHAMGLGKTMQT
jgi:SNF2 family DNA or RNA helicase